MYHTGSHLIDLNQHGGPELRPVTSRTSRAVSPPGLPPLSSCCADLCATSCILVYVKRSRSTLIIHYTNNAGGGEESAAIAVIGDGGCITSIVARVGAGRGQAKLSLVRSTLMYPKTSFNRHSDLMVELFGVRVVRVRKGDAPSCMPAFHPQP